jgi:hypothetical protein
VFAQHLPAGILSQVAYGVVFAIADSDLSNGTLGARAATITSLLMLGVPETRAIALVVAPAFSRPVLESILTEFTSWACRRERDAADAKQEHAQAAKNETFLVTVRIRPGRTGLLRADLYTPSGRAYVRGSTCPAIRRFA